MQNFELVAEIPEFAISFLAVDDTMWVGSEGRIKIISGVRLDPHHFGAY